MILGKLGRTIRFILKNKKIIYTVTYFAKQSFGKKNQHIIVSQKSSRFYIEKMHRLQKWDQD